MKTPISILLIFGYYSTLPSSEAPQKNFKKESRSVGSVSLKGYFVISDKSVASTVD